MTKSSQYSIFDFLPIASALVIGVSLVLPWLNGSSGLAILGQNPRCPKSDVALSLLWFVVIAAVGGGFAGLWGLFNSTRRRTTSIAACLSGVIGLTYYAFAVVENNTQLRENNQDTLGVIGVGFWLALLASLVLTFQVFIRGSDKVKPAGQVGDAPDIQKEAESGQTAARAIQRRRTVINFWRVLVLVVILGGWEITTRATINGKAIVDPFFYGQPTGIAGRIVTWVCKGTAQGTLWEQIGVTLEETFLGFGVGVVLGIVFGVALGRVRALADVFGPYINVANSIPRVVLASIFTIALGLGLTSKVATAVVLVFFVVFYNAFQGVREADRNLIANARILGASPWQVSINVILPSALSWIIASLHTSLGFALVGAVVSEFLGALKGIGLMIATAQGTFDANGVFAAMFILAIVALLAEWLVTRLERRLLVWRPVRTDLEVGM